MREEVIWVGDGIRADAPEQIGRPVNINGRKGKVVDASMLTITIEWDAVASARIRTGRTWKWAKKWLMPIVPGIGLWVCWWAGDRWYLGGLVALSVLFCALWYKLERLSKSHGSGKGTAQR